MSDATRMRLFFFLLAPVIAYTHLISWMCGVEFIEKYRFEPDPDDD